MERGDVLSLDIECRKGQFEQTTAVLQDIDRIYRQCNNLINQTKLMRENQVCLIFWQEIVPPDAHFTVGLFFLLSWSYQSLCVHVCVASSLGHTFKCVIVINS